MKNTLLRRSIAWVVMLTLTMTQATQVAALTLAQTPLAATTTATVRPNIMYVLDDSGSMAWDYSPDYINDTTTAADPGSLGGSIGDGIKATVVGGKVTAITATAPPFNTSYTSVPTVVITGGGGTGAAATVNFAAGNFPKVIQSITVTSQGSGYTSTPFAALVGGLNSATWGMCWGTTGTSNLGGTPKDTTQSPGCTGNSQMPYATAAINRMYYDPAVLYTAPLKADGSSYANSTPTAARNDGFSSSTSSLNLTSNWTHEVWCNASTATPTAADPTSGGKCRENTDTTNNTLYPNVTYNFRKTYPGPATYFTLNTSQFCTDTNQTNCVPATTAQVIGGVTFNVPATYRWCSFYNPLSHTFGSCQARRDLTHYVPDYLGGWVSTGATGAQASATMTVNSVISGQSITGVTIGGQDVVGGATFVAGASDTTTTIAQAICAAVNANTSTSGYGCAGAGNTLILQAAIVGTAANGQPVVASGPPAGVSSNSTGSIFVLSAPINYQITGINITRTDGPPATVIPLINTTVTSATTCPASGVDCGNVARDICNAINSGPNTAHYIAKSGNPADGTLNWGTCQSQPQAWVAIQRIDVDGLDNGAAISVSGPPNGNSYPGSIIINPTGGQTRINDITIGGTSILTSKPLTYADGLATSAIATDVASKISISGCTASASGSTVSIAGSATCNGAISVTATGASATGVFQVNNSSSSGHAGYAGDLGGIDIGSTHVVGHVGNSQITLASAASTNASTLSGQVNNGTSATSNGVGPHGFTASAPVASGSNYQVTVTAPAGSTYNNTSFTFLSGSAAAGVTGQRPQWTFPITDASADNRNLTSITCGGTTAVPTRNTGSTTADVTYVQNLANGLNGQSSAGLAGYSYSCTNAAMTSPQYRCTVTGPAGVAACGNLAITKDSSITLSTTSPAASGGTATGSNTWTFNVTNATTDNMSISQVRCGPTAGAASTSSGTRTLNSAASTGTSVTSGNYYAQVLANAIQNNSFDGPTGANAFRGSINSCTASGSTVSCTIARWADSSGGNACPGAVSPSARPAATCLSVRSRNTMTVIM